MHIKFSIILNGRSSNSFWVKHKQNGLLKKWKKKILQEISSKRNVYSKWFLSFAHKMVQYFKQQQQIRYQTEWGTHKIRWATKKKNSQKEIQRRKSKEKINTQHRSLTQFCARRTKLKCMVNYVIYGNLHIFTPNETIFAWLSMHEQFTFLFPGLNKSIRWMTALRATTTKLKYLCIHGNIIAKIYLY